MCGPPICPSLLLCVTEGTACMHEQTACHASYRPCGGIDRSGGHWPPPQMGDRWEPPPHPNPHEAMCPLLLACPLETAPCLQPAAQAAAHGSALVGMQQGHRKAAAVVECGVEVLFCARDKARLARRWAGTQRDACLLHHQATARDQWQWPLPFCWQRAATTSSKVALHGRGA